MFEKLKLLKCTFKRFFLRILAYFPTRLPVGMTAYNAWLASIVDLVGPIADQNSLEWVISNEIMYLPKGRDYASKRHFVKAIRKFAANQLAAAKVNEIKQRQEQQKAEATVSSQAVDVKPR